MGLQEPVDEMPMVENSAGTGIGLQDQKRAQKTNLSTWLGEATAADQQNLWSCWRSGVEALAKTDGQSVVKVGVGTYGRTKRFQSVHVAVTDGQKRRQGGRWCWRARRRQGRRWELRAKRIQR